MSFQTSYCLGFGLEGISGADVLARSLQYLLP